MVASALATSAANGRGSITNSTSPLRTSAAGLEVDRLEITIHASAHVDGFDRLDAARELVGLDDFALDAAATLTGGGPGGGPTCASGLLQAATSSAAAVTKTVRNKTLME